ncbi:MAG: hypothetical protein HOK84_05210 [Bacteroidetes bacterium]|jgi:hypothetical protein|nr:hypothetical protein [Bacteroidota bacterium]
MPVPKNMRNIFLILFLSFILFNSAQAQDPFAKIVEQRSQNKKIQECIYGGLLFLADRQVLDRQGKHSCMFDATESTSGAKNRAFINLPFLTGIPIYPGNKRPAVNAIGGWAGTVHALPKTLGFKNGNSILSRPDFNLFIPMSVLYPLFLFDESDIPPDKRIISKMIKNSWNTLESYNRGSAYNFWLPLKSHPEYTGPGNLSFVPLEKLSQLIKTEQYQSLRNKNAKKKYVPDATWSARFLDKELNPTGGIAMFNIPNDGDDAALVIAFQQLRKLLYEQYPKDEFFSNPDNYPIDHKTLRQFALYRDIDRLPANEDGRDTWKGYNSGAYLTWFKDEADPVFDNPMKGTIPFGKNNVDGLVNANILYMLGLLNASDYPGYSDCINLVSKAIIVQSWPKCGLYYPQLMMFPYAASRAFRDGQIKELKPAMAVLLRQILNLKEIYSSQDRSHKGAFPGGEDPTDHLSTALAVCALLNISREVAREEGLVSKYDEAINEGIKYLMKKRRRYALVNNNELPLHPAGEKNIKAYRWKSGLYFSSSFWDLAHWRSEAFTVAMVIEAVSKYALAWDYRESGIITGSRYKLVFK